MKKNIKWLALVLSVIMITAVFVGCDNKPDPKPAETVYYLTGSFNGYNVADEAYIMKKVSEESMLVQAMPDAELYYFTVDASALVPDAVYGQHYYKVTAGDWDNCWGTEKYDLQPAAVYYDADGNPTGLGSIYIPGDYKGELLVVFDAVTKTIYDNVMQKDFSPRLYGDFNTSFGLKNDWDYSDEGSFEMTKKGDIYEVTLDLPAYAGEGADGATIYVVLNAKCYMAVNSAYDYISWGAGTQFMVSGTGAENTIKPSVATSYVITYDPVTNAVGVKVK